VPISLLAAVDFFLRGAHRTHGKTRKKKKLRSEEAEKKRKEEKKKRREEERENLIFCV
jgi:hypothetical protein